MMYPKRKTNNAAVDIVKNPPEKDVSSTSNAKALNTSGFLSNNLNSSLSQHKNNTASIIPNRKLLQLGTNTQQVTGSRPNRTATRKAKLKTFMTTSNAKDYRHWKTFSESKSKLKAYQNPFAGFKWMRNQDPAIGHTFKRINNSQGHQITAWIQQRHFQPAPLMRHPEPRLQTPDKDDSVLSVPPQSGGNILSPHDYHSN